MAKHSLLIVGGVAGGASCAARARRLDEEAGIILFERGPFVSFANCGLPYHVGNVIKKERRLLVATPERFRERFNIDVRTGHEVVSIDREKKAIKVRDLETGRDYTEDYDSLVLSPGAAPFKPPVPGIDLPGIFTVRTIPDIRAIKSWIAEKNARRAVVVGAGFIGLEMAENLHLLGMDVALVELQSQVLPLFDPEIAIFLQSHLAQKGVGLHLGTGVTGFVQTPGQGLLVSLDNGKSLETDMVICAVGVRPESGLAKAAGLELGKSGGIVTDGRMRTSDPNIFAVGDAAEVRGMVLGDNRLVPLAGPANRQGRLVADVLFGKTDPPPRLPGSLGTWVCGAMGLTAAACGETEHSLKTRGGRVRGTDYEAIYCYPYEHAGYYPGAFGLTIKLLFSRPDGKILGVQVLGKNGVDKRVDVISMAMANNNTVHDLANAELCYAPPYGAAKDPVNMAAMIASNVVDGYAEIAYWDELTSSDALVLDVRTKPERDKGAVPGSVHIPVDNLRQRMGELPRDREIWAHCAEGQRSYYAVRILAQNGFKVKNLTGGFEMHKALSQIQRKMT